MNTLTQLQILIDENLPDAERYFSQLGKVAFFNGRKIAEYSLYHVSVLIVRSVTRIDSELLDKMPHLSFIGTATIGIDHLDISEIEKRNITWNNAKGCNALAVSEYVLQVMGYFYHHHHLPIKRVGVIGAGNTGMALINKLIALHIPFFICDPFTKHAHLKDYYRDIEVLFQHCSIVSCHVPLEKTVKNNTEYFITLSLLFRLPKNALFINSSRGEVISEFALLALKEIRSDIFIALDVFENEPYVNDRLLQSIDLATPHIAGYSVEGKQRAIYTLFHDCLRFYQVDCNLLSTDDESTDSISYYLNQETDFYDLYCYLRSYYDIETVSHEFKLHQNQFDMLRKSALLRHECLSLESE